MKSLLHLIIALCIVGMTTTTAAAAPTTAVLSGVCINEILIDPTGFPEFDTDGNTFAHDGDEFVELYNLSGSAVDISGWEIWDSGTGKWFTFPGSVDSGTTILQPASYALVMVGVQIGGALPTMTGSGDLAFHSGRSSAVLNNGGDNVVLYDPGANAYIQLRYNNDPADTPNTTYSGFNPNATRQGSVENWGTIGSGISLTRYPSGDTAVSAHTTATPGGANASPTAIGLTTFTASQTSSIYPAPLLTALVLCAAVVRRAAARRG